MSISPPVTYWNRVTRLINFPRTAGTDCFTFKKYTCLRCLVWIKARLSMFLCFSSQLDFSYSIFRWLSCNYQIPIQPPQQPCLSLKMSLTRFPLALEFLEYIVIRRGGNCRLGVLRIKEGQQLTRFSSLFHAFVAICDFKTGKHGALTNRNHVEGFT